MSPEHSGFMCIAPDCDNEADGPGMECGRCRMWSDIGEAIRTGKPWVKPESYR